MLSTVFSITALIAFLFCMIPAFAPVFLKKRFPLIRQAKKYHVYSAIVTVVCAFFHAYVSEPSIAAYSGKLAMVWVMVLILLALPLTRQKGTLWKKLHRKLSFLVLFFLFLHVIHALIC